MRDPLANYARSAYACEVNPWTTRGDIEAALFFRGTIVSAFGHIDVSLSEFAIQCSRLPEYEGIAASYPYRFEKRLNYLRNVFSRGPLARSQRIANLFIDRLEQAYDLRNLCAHGKMQVLPDWGVTLTDFPESSPSHVVSRRQRYTLKELEIFAFKAARLSRLCMALLEKLRTQIGLPFSE